MTSLEKNIENKRLEIQALANETNATIRELAQVNYDLDVLFYFNDLGVPCIDSSRNVELLKQKSRLETSLKKKMKTLDAERNALHEMQEMDRTSASESEEWKPVNIKGGIYAQYYEVSNKGNVRSYRKGKWGIQDNPKPLSPDNGVYRKVNLVANDGSHKLYTVHSLVANAFLPNPHHYKYINHKDGNKKNNHVENLEWCTQGQNMEHASKHGLLYSKPIREIATGKEYPSIYEAARQIGCPPARIYSRLAGYRGRRIGDALEEYVG